MWDFIDGMVFGVFFQNSPVLQAVVKKCWRCTLLQLPISHLEFPWKPVVCAATVLPLISFPPSPKVLTGKQQLPPVTALRCHLAGNSCLASLGHRLTVERPRPREAGAVVNSVSVSGHELSRKATISWDISVFSYQWVQGMLPVSPCLRHFMGDEARKDLKEQPRDCQLWCLYTFYFGCSQAYFGVGVRFLCVI